jgi:NTE family protein
MTERRVDLVFEGGGVKGVGLVGALAVLEEQGFEPQNVAGASAGAIAATLLAAGYRAAELREIVLNLDFRSFEDRAWEDRVPLVGTPLSILKDQGVYEGAAFAAWMRGLLEGKGVRTFRDLVHPAFAEDERYRYRVNVIASDLTAHRLLVLPQHARTLGIEPDDLDVALAVRMSTSIPFFFEPVRILHPETGDEHLIADGGVLSNFPVWLFDQDGEPDWPTFGLLLVEPDPRAPIGARIPQPARAGRWVGGTIGYVRSLIQTMLEAHDRLYLEQADFARTIPVESLGIGTTEFDLARERAEALYASGRRAATEFLDRWDFEGYK